MGQKIALVVFLFLFSTASANGSEDISFKGTDKSPSGEQLTLTGKLYKPQGNYLFPAVVLMHGCNGVAQSYISWAKKINSWGYVTLVLDSFAPRGHGNICGKIDQVPFYSRVQDAYDAKAYLSQLPFVNRHRIGVMGWSHGGCATLASVSQSNLEGMFYIQMGGSKIPVLSNYLEKAGPFQAAIAFYPLCLGNLGDSESPLLILMGNKDSWTPAGSCKSNMPEGKTKNEVILKIYEDATHAFDIEMPDRVMYAHKMSFDPQATTDAIYRISAFLKKYLYD